MCVSHLEIDFVAFGLLPHLLHQGVPSCGDNKNRGKGSKGQGGGGLCVCLEWGVCFVGGGGGGG